MSASVSKIQARAHFACVECGGGISGSSPQSGDHCTWSDGFSEYRAGVLDLLTCDRCDALLWLPALAAQEGLAAGVPLELQLASLEGAGAPSAKRLWQAFILADSGASNDVLNTRQGRLNELAPEYRASCALRLLWDMNSIATGRHAPVHAGATLEHARRRNLLAALLEHDVERSARDTAVLFQVVEWLRELGQRSAAKRVLPAATAASERLRAMEILLHCRVHQVARWPEAIPRDPSQYEPDREAKDAAYAAAQDAAQARWTCAFDELEQARRWTRVFGEPAHHALDPGTWALAQAAAMGNALLADRLYAVLRTGGSPP